MIQYIIKKIRYNIAWYLVARYETIIKQEIKDVPPKGSIAWQLRLVRLLFSEIYFSFAWSIDSQATIDYRNRKG